MKNVLKPLAKIVLIPLGLTGGNCTTGGKAKDEPRTSSSFGLA